MLFTYLCQLQEREIIQKMCLMKEDQKKIIKSCQATCWVAANAGEWKKPKISTSYDGDEKIPREFELAAVHNVRLSQENVTKSFPPASMNGCRNHPMSLIKFERKKMYFIPTFY